MAPKEAVYKGVSIFTLPHGHSQHFNWLQNFNKEQRGIEKAIAWTNSAHATYYIKSVLDSNTLHIFLKTFLI